MQRLRLFGGIAIEVDGQPLAGRAVQRRRLALLALLATSRARGGTGSGLSRDKLIALLWPTADAENGRRYLSDSVYRVNDALGAEVIAGEGDTLRLDSALLSSDVLDFHAAHSAGDHAAAVALYSGPLMDGFFLPDSPDFERWTDGERERLASEYARSLEALADEATRRNAHADAVHWLRMLAAHDPYSSRVAVLLMKALRDAGDRAGAIRHARVHEELLKQDLELVPDPQVAAFAESLRKDGAEPHVDRAAPVAPQSSPVSDQPPAAAVSAVSSVSPVVQPFALSRRWLLPAAAIVVLVIAAGVIYNRTRATTGPVRSVAVLPFANLSADSANEYFSDGMTEELITTLGRVHGLEVASRTSAFAYKGRRLDIRDIGRELGVDAVVEGSVRKSGSSLRINTQLVDARSGYRLWSEAYERDANDVFAVQEEIARAIAGRVTGVLPDVDAPVQQGAARNFEAYDLYLRGRYAWHQRTPAGLRQAIEYFSRSVALDPSYARAHAGLGDAYAVSAFYDFLPPREAYPKADSATSRALHLDPGLAAAYATRGYVLTYYHLDWPEAERMFERAIAIDPSYSVAHQWYGNLLTVSGRFADAEREFSLAQETDPLSLIASAARGWTLHYAGRHVAAVEALRTTLALNDRYALAHLWGGWSLEALGRNDEALAWLRRADELAGGSHITRLAIAHALAASSAGRDSALSILGAMESRARSGEYVPAYEIAKVHLALGDRAQALRWLERAVNDRSHSRAFLRVDPQLRPLRGDARFERLVAATLAR